MLRLEWIGSYDRDGDLRDYVVEIGSAPGKSDVGVFRTADTWLDVSVNREGVCYWRVCATDRHGEGTAYEERIYYLDSKETELDTARQSELDARVYPPAVEPGPANAILSLDSADGSLGGLERREGLDDCCGGGLWCTTELFNISYGAHGRVLHLMDPTNRWFSDTVVRSAWSRRLDRDVLPGMCWEFSVLMMTGRSFLAGDHAFPMLFLLDRDEPGPGIGFCLDPMSVSVQHSMRKWGTWYDMARVDPTVLILL